MKLQYSYILLIAAILATAPIHAAAGNNKEESKEAVYIERISVTAGEVFEIPVMFRNENTYSAFQCDIELPEGITFEKDEYGDYCIYPESGRVTQTHTMTAAEIANGKVRVACYSMSSKDIIGNDGVLFYIKAKAEENCSGTVTMSMTNIIFSNAEGVETTMGNTEAEIEVEPRKEEEGGEEEESKEAVYIERISVTAGEVFEIPVMFRNENTYSAFQCDIELPEGITFEKDEYGDYCIYPESGRVTQTHTMTAAEIANGKVRVACYSMSSKEIIGNDGALFYIKAKAGKECEGEMNIMIDNILFSTANAVENELGSAKGTITIIPPTEYYIITYMVDGNVYASDSIEYGTTIEPIAEPTKEGYTFSGWADVPGTMPAEDVTITGSFTVNSYTVTFMIDGEVYDTATVEYGAEIELPTPPEREGYTFSGWADVPETMPAENVTIIGSFTVNSYTVTFMIDGEVYDTATVEYGAEIKLPTPPEREGYTFSGWTDVPETMPAEDITITGSFTVNSYTVTFMIDGEVYDTATVEYGAEIELPTPPEREGYTFSGWTNVPETMPAEDVTITGSFTVNSYTVTFMIDGEVYDTATVEYGAEIELPTPPEREGYTFSGWADVPETMPAEDVTITGSFTVNSYTVTFMIDGEVYDTATVEYGAEIELPSPPEREGYTFSGWTDVPETMPAEDITIEGCYVVIPTGIDELKNQNTKVKTVYDLNGRKLEKPGKGIYIINGKKRFMK